MHEIGKTSQEANRGKTEVPYLSLKYLWRVHLVNYYTNLEDHHSHSQRLQTLLV